MTDRESMRGAIGAKRSPEADGEATGGAAGSRSRLYTRTGDDGSTGLFSDERVSKDDPRIEAYGTVDELNAALGWVRAWREGRTEASLRGADRDGVALIERIVATLQDRLFELGADLATPPGSKFADRVNRMSDTDVAEAERWIDEVDAANPPLHAFVLPGGSELAARLHVARTVARRAERAIVALSHNEAVGQSATRFVNRVSDLLFAMARRANHELGVQDVPWRSRAKSS
ncbi:MAG: cob(I)yrinic acid a,c-diamide adenosyltransferase [Phycisphaeraceae bacterium]|nr:cob(I)yrinic acid a,c-diamide adenosyltransferase [Phycisphaeraceae bacterium]